MGNMKERVQEILKLADVKINGSRPWDIHVHDERLYRRVLAGGSLALGESYMDEWWDCTALDQFFDKILRVQLDKKVMGWKFLWDAIKAKIMNLQSPSRAFHIGEHHYDIGNDLYSLMLDKRMNYSCGYWKNTKDLDKAQEQKLDLICRKLGLKKGMRVLDIGCGWGGFLHYAASKYGVTGVGVTVSKEQAKLARARCKGLPVQIKLKDYRDIKGSFDRIISIGMIEHVGYKNYRTYMGVAHRCLKEGGMFLLHTIGGNTSVHATDRWISKYIFPNSMLPSAKQLTTAFEGLFVLEDWHSFGTYYDKTLMVWYANFVKAWPKLRKVQGRKHPFKYDARFYRMWEYYLLCCAGGFRARKNQLWQIVLSKKGVKGGYESIR